MAHFVEPSSARRRGFAAYALANSAAMGFSHVSAMGRAGLAAPIARADDPGGEPSDSKACANWQRQSFSRRRGGDSRRTPAATGRSPAAAAAPTRHAHQVIAAPRTSPRLPP